MIQMLAYDLELITLLAKAIRDRQVILHNISNFYFDVLEQFYPIGFNRISWNRIDHVYENLAGLETEKKRVLINSFFENILKNYPQLLNARVFVFGDGEMGLTYEMNFTLFKDLAIEFFEFPQHTYAYFKELNKCINYTFEDELYFG